MLRKCTKCGKFQPISAFYRKRKIALHSWCKNCEKAYTNNYLKSPHGRSVRATWLDANPARLRKYQDKANVRLRAQRKDEPDRFRSYDLKKRIGITLAEKNAKFEQQGRQCAICHVKAPNTKGTWFADHNHKTKKFRGVLCGECNSFLGHACDNPVILMNAIFYLGKESE